MGKRSLKASPLGMAKAKQAFQRREWTQEYLASAVGLQTRQPIWKFFSGRPIERHLFIDICFQLDLDWEDIVEAPKLQELGFKSTSESSFLHVEQVEFDWIQSVRSFMQSSLQHQDDPVQQILNRISSLTLSNIYTDSYLLPYLSNQRWLDVEDFQPVERPVDAFNRGQLSNSVSSLTESSSAFLSQKVSVLDAIAAHSRLMILGKPGAGKTATLHHLVRQCLEGNVQGNRLPVFLTLRDWASHIQAMPLNLEHYLSQCWTACGVSPQQVQAALQQGKIWLFLDGLDEVSPEMRKSLQWQIQQWVEGYPHLPMVITSRLAAQDYHFRGFTYMEVADFDPTQIATFTQKWFIAVNPTAPETGIKQAQQFLEQLQKQENQPIRELAITPILLHLACLVFHERGAFLKKRSRLYQRGLDILLVQWDAIRGIQRCSTPDQLALSDRLNILSQLAATTFERGQYFFEKTEVLAVIVEYLTTLPNHSSDPEVLWAHSEAILQTLVLQHGLLVERAQDVYSFSHLTFQEYLTARKFLTQNLVNVTPPARPYSLERLASYVADPRWQNVIGLTVELLPHTQPLLLQMECHLHSPLTTPLLTNSPLTTPLRFTPLWLSLSSGIKLGSGLSNVE